MTQNTSDFNQEQIAILDFGSQYNQLIARKVRESGTYAEIFPCNIEIEELRKRRVIGIILSGGPGSVYESQAPTLDQSILELNVPILGICYGMQIMVKTLGGNVQGSKTREYGPARFRQHGKSLLFTKIPESLNVWMSHGDKVVCLPKGFSVIGQTDSCDYAAIEYADRHLYGVQFHPEVAHSQKGKKIIKNFINRICEAKQKWRLSSFVKHELISIKKKVGDGRVILGLSGGVDSSVAAVILQKAIGNQLTCVFVDNGLLRKNERQRVVEVFKKHYQMNLVVVDAQERFLSALGQVLAPEQKRKIIGRLFVEVFNEQAQKLGGFDFLAQGTLYPDVIESVSTKGPSDVIKSHHNRVSEILAIEKEGKLIEPLKELFKDEVRKIGKQLAMPEDIIHRQPFPGPGLAVRIVGEITTERLEILREADAILLEEIKNAKWYKRLWQSFAVFLPVQSVGVMGDKRTYENVIALRMVLSKDAMTAAVAPIPYPLLTKISNRIINEVAGINRVVYDISSKPPATIEWE